MAHSRSRRIHVLDELRGFCVILMVFYHAFYTIGYVFDIAFAETLFDFFKPAEPLFAGLFIFISGFCCHLSRNNLKRGLSLAGVAILLTAVLWCAEWWRMLPSGSVIWFGVLHCLAACMLVYALFRPTLRCLPAWLGALLCAALFVLCYHVPEYNGAWFGIPGVFRWSVPAATQNNPWLYALGLCPVSATGDYFPLLPWLFCFLTGSYVGTWRRHLPKWAYRRRVPFLARAGQWSLWIYLLHQPFIYAVCTLVTML